MRVSVVILNWNTRAYLERWLPSLLDSLGPEDEAVVADNGSTDGSVEMLREKFPSVRTIVFERNLGFTGGYNAALSQVDADYFVLANSDIEFSSGWLEPLVSYMNANPDCAVCGPKLHALVGGKCLDRFEYAGAAGGMVDRFGFPFCRGRVLSRTEEDHGQYDGAPFHALWVTGACMMVRSSVWRELGGLDDRFFAHMEEIDFCWRANLAGWTVDVIPDSVVWHLGGGTLPQSSPFKLKLNYRNNLMLLDNNLAATIGKRKASVIISIRKCLDICAALAYMLTLRPACAHAVLDAHLEYRKLKRRKAASGGISPEGGNGRRSVHGYRPICIIPLAFLKREKIFAYIAAEI